MIIKAFLIVSVLAACAWLLRSPASSRREAFTRVSGLAFTGSWILAVLFPDLVTEVARAMGVGLGTNLVLYLLVVAFTFSTIANRLRTRQLEEKLAALARAQALHEHHCDRADRQVA
jgi:hypothetical protein